MWHTSSLAKPWGLVSLTHTPWYHITSLCNQTLQNGESHHGPRLPAPFHRTCSTRNFANHLLPTLVFLEASTMNAHPKRKMPGKRHSKWKHARITNQVQSESRKSVEKKNPIKTKKTIQQKKKQMSHATNEVLKKKTIWAPLAASIPLNDVSKPQDSVPGETDWIYGQCQKPLVASCFGVCVYVYIQYIGICIDIYIYTWVQYGIWSSFHVVGETHQFNLVKTYSKSMYIHFDRGNQNKTCIFICPNNTFPKTLHESFTRS